MTSTAQHSTAQHSTAQHKSITDDYPTVNSKNTNLIKAKREKNDEFYTQYFDIEKEINAYLDFDENTFRGKTVLLPCDDPEWSNFTKYFAQNFTRLGLKKLISTSFQENGRGKLFSVTRDVNHDGVIDLKDLEWEYLESNGDFRNEEIKTLRDEADIIVTNPPFSLFREFLAWIIEADKKFLVIANKNSVACKEIFPLIKENKIWSGRTEWGSMLFNTPDENNEISIKNIPSIWLTNLEHGRRHQPLQLMTMADNLKFNKRVAKESNCYKRYDNYDAIEVSFTNAIPSDYEGIMGVPISFLDKYCPEQFEILGIDFYVKDGLLNDIKICGWTGKMDKAYLDGNRLYSRILIRHKK